MKLNSIGLEVRSTKLQTAAAGVACLPKSKRSSSSELAPTKKISYTHVYLKLLLKSEQKIKRQAFHM